MFELHPTLAKDSLPIHEDDDLAIRLINDARFPWVLLIPKRAELSELHDLDQDLYAKLMNLARDLGAAMKQAFDADKINTAAIGNMVPQLHLHVVARTTDDAAWPGPVWGAGDMQPMSEDAARERIQTIRRLLSVVETQK